MKIKFISIISILLLSLRVAVGSTHTHDHSHVNDSNPVEVIDDCEICNLITSTHFDIVNSVSSELIVKILFCEKLSITSLVLFTEICSNSGRSPPFK